MCRHWVEGREAPRSGVFVSKHRNKVAHYAFLKSIIEILLLVPLWLFLLRLDALLCAGNYPIVFVLGLSQCKMLICQPCFLKNKVNPFPCFWYRVSNYLPKLTL